MAQLHLEVHYGVDLASDLGTVNTLCAALLDLDFGSTMRVLAFERDPFEAARPETVFRWVRDHGFSLRYLTTCGGGLGCNEFVFERSARCTTS